MKNLLWMILIILVSAFQPAKEAASENEADDEAYQASTLIGAWNAEWSTTLEAIPEAKDAALTMNGTYNFSEDSVWIELYGYEGCLFYQDTLTNRIRWSLSGDTLSLISEDNTPSITYDVRSLSKDKIELVLLGDIFITLTP